MSDYYTLKIKEVVRETPDTITIHFKQPLFKKVRYKAGQFLTVLLDIDGQRVRRSYSMSSAPTLDATVAISVKRVEGGLVSNYLNEKAKAGEKIEVMQPMGNFTLEPDKKAVRHVVLFGGGSGITPLMSILKTVLFFEPNSTVSLVYCNRDEDSIIFKSKLEEYKEKFGERFNLVHVLETPKAHWTGYSGRIDPAMTANVVNLLPKLDPKATEYFVCGPTGMMDQVEEGLAALKVSKSRIRRESFVAAPTDASSLEGLTTQKVKIILNGEEHEISVGPDESILDRALDEGLDMPFSCQSGLCTACMGKKLAGEVRLEDSDALSADEIEQGYVLTCVGHPTSEGVVIEIE